MEEHRKELARIANEQSSLRAVLRVRRAKLKEMDIEHIRYNDIIYKSVSPPGAPSLGLCRFYNFWRLTDLILMVTMYSWTKRESTIVIDAVTFYIFRYVREWVNGEVIDWIVRLPKDLRSQQLEGRIKRMEGDVSPKDRDRQEAQVRQLTEELDAHNAREKEFRSQLNLIQVCVSRAQEGRNCDRNVWFVFCLHPTPVYLWSVWRGIGDAS